jgi:hypothetical protein
MPAKKHAKLGGHQCCLCAKPIDIGAEIWPVKQSGPKAKVAWTHVECARQHYGTQVLVPPVCPYWARKGVCAFGEGCFYGHPPGLAAQAAPAAQAAGSPGSPALLATAATGRARATTRPG